MFLHHFQYTIMRVYPTTTVMSSRGNLADLSDLCGASAMALSPISSRYMSAEGVLPPIFRLLPQYNTNISNACTSIATCWSSSWRQFGHYEKESSPSCGFAAGARPVIISHSPDANQNESAMLVSLGTHPTPPARYYRY